MRIDPVASLLPIPDDPRLVDLIEGGLALFPDKAFPRSWWLRYFEDALRLHYPQASSRDLSLTARHAAPFPLRDGPNVP